MMNYFSSALRHGVFLTAAFAALLVLAVGYTPSALELPNSVNSNEPNCTFPFTAVRRSCLYFANDLTLSHTEAQFICEALAGNLVAIETSQKLTDIVTFINKNYNNLQTSYWIDGDRDSSNKWSFPSKSGATFPMGTPFWGTSKDYYGYKQRPLNNSGDCLVIPYDKSYYFTEAKCDLEISSPLCEQETPCGEVFEGYEGTIVSPLYPSFYTSDSYCQWIVNTPENTTIRVHFESFYTEYTDYLVIRDGNDSNATEIFRKAGSYSNLDDVISSNNSLYFTFTSVYSDPGFKLNWAAEPGIICPPLYTKIGSECLAFVFSPETFNEAKVSCASMNGELGKITNVEQLRLLYIYIQESGIADDSFWIGGSDKNQEGKFVYEDGTDVPQGTPFWGTTGENSEIQEPDGLQKDNCITLLAEGHHFLRDVPCTTQMKFLCSTL